MKVCVLGSRSYPPIIGGLETHIYELMSRLATRKYEISVIVSAPGRHISKEMVGKVQVVRVPTSKNYYLSKLSMVPPVSSIIREISPDLYHAHDATFGFVASAFYRDRPTVYTAHAITFRTAEWKFPVNKILKMYQTVAFQQATTVMCVDYATYDMVKRYRDDVLLIYNGVNVEEFGRDYETPGEYDADKVRLLFVGRLVQVKGLEYLFEALRKIDNKVSKKIELYIIGTGALELWLKEKAQGLPVKFLGSIEHSKIMAYYRHADVFILPSLSEGLPISLLEAMGSGRACICTAVGDIPKRFENGKELIIISPGNVREIVRALMKLIEDEDLRNELGKKARETIIKNYSWDNVVDIVDKVYRKIGNE